MAPEDPFTVETPENVLARTGRSELMTVESVPLTFNGFALAEKPTPRVNIPVTSRTNSFRIRAFLFGHGE
jgi:hypothetical protein